MAAAPVELHVKPTRTSGRAQFGLPINSSSVEDATFITQSGSQHTQSKSHDERVVASAAAPLGTSDVLLLGVVVLG